MMHTSPPPSFLFFSSTTPAPTPNPTSTATARDDLKLNRTTGGDKFHILVDYIGIGDGADSVRLGGVSTEDLSDGRYIVKYFPKYPGKYKIFVDFLGTFGGLGGPLRGTGTIITFFENVPRENNNLAGPILLKSLRTDVEYIKKFTKDLSYGIFVRVKDDTWSSEEQIRVLMNVKEGLLKAESQAAEINLLVDRSECVAEFLSDQDVSIGGLDEALQVGKTLWDKILRESGQVLSKIAPIMRAHAGKIRGDIQSYEAHVLAYKEELQNSEYYRYATGPYRSAELLNSANQMHIQQKAICEKMKHISNVFDCVRDMDGSIKIIEDVR